MDTFSNWSETTFAPAKPYDPEADRTFLETISDWGSRVRSTPISTDDLARVHDAASRRARLVDSLRSEEIGRADWFASAADRVKAETGVELRNPYFAPASGGGSPGLINAAVPTETRDDLERQFFAKVAELAPHHPALADIVGTDVDRAVRQTATSAAGAEGGILDDRGVNPLVKLAGGLSGDLSGKLSTMDPATVASLFLPIGGKGATAAARVLDAALVQGVGGAVTTAAEQPAIQAWRGELGLPHGFGAAATDIAYGTFFGAAGGAVFQGAGEAFKRLVRGSGTREDAAAVVRDLRAAGAHVSDETEAALARAAVTDASIGEALAARPAGVPEHAAVAQLAEGLAALEDPAHPLPLVDREIPAGTTDDLARRLTDEAASMTDAIDRLQATEGAIDSALVSADPALRDLGRLASLDPDIIASVVRGETSLTQASILAGASPDPRLQAAAFAALGEARPATIAEARRVVSDAVSTSSGSEVAMMRGAEPDRPLAFGDAAEAVKAEWRAASPYTDAAAMLAAAPNNQASLGALGREIAAELGVAFRDPGVKGAPRFLEKVGTGKAGRVTDLVRGGFEIGSPAAAEAVVARLAARFDVIDEGWVRTFAGYFDRKLYVRFDDGMIGEVQLWEPSLLGAKSRGGHALYERYRSLPAGDPGAAALLGEMQKLYGDAYAALSPDWRAVIDGGVGSAPNLARKASADSGRASMATSAALTDTQAPSRNANAWAGENTAGSPSKEQNSQSMRASSGSTRPIDRVESQGGTDLRGAVPLVRDDGTVSIVSRADLGRVAERERWMGEVIAACKI